MRRLAGAGQTQKLTQDRHRRDPGQTKRRSRTDAEEIQDRQRVEAGQTQNRYRTDKEKK